MVRSVSISEHFSLYLLVVHDAAHLLVNIGLGIPEVAFVVHIFVLHHLVRVYLALLHSVGNPGKLHLVL